MRKLGLRAEDGAQFFGVVEKIDDQFRVSCYAQMDHKDRIETEEPEYHLCASEGEAVKWIELRTSQRGFHKYRLTHN